MTVSSETIRKSYAGDGSQDTFPYTWKIYAETDLLVMERDDTTLEETEQVLNTDYTVTGVGDDNGGNVVAASAPASGKTWVIKLDLPFTQLTDWVENDPFPANTHEDAADRAVKLAQILNEKFDRSLLLPVSSPLSGLELPEKTGDARMLAWNITGDEIELVANVTTTPFTIESTYVVLDDYHLRLRDDASKVIEFRVAGTTQPGTITFWKSRGTLVSPTDVQELDPVGLLDYEAYVGSAWQPVAMFEVLMGPGAVGACYFDFILTDVDGTYGRVAQLDYRNNLLLSNTPLTTDGRRVFILKNAATAPTSSPADAIQMYSADQAAGNACPHFRTENGKVIKLYQQAHIADPTDLATCITAIGSILDALEALGLLATS